jgi:hypothetical protein
MTTLSDRVDSRELLREAVAITVDLTHESLLRDLHVQPDPTWFSSQYRVDEKLYQGA